MQRQQCQEVWPPIATTRSGAAARFARAADAQHDGQLSRNGSHGFHVHPADHLAHFGQPDRLWPVHHHLRRDP